MSFHLNEMNMLVDPYLLQYYCIILNSLNITSKLQISSLVYQRKNFSLGKQKFPLYCNIQKALKKEIDFYTHFT